MTTPEKFCQVVRDSFKETYIVYNYGACYNFYTILKEVFPKAEAYFYNEHKGHIATKIGKDYYDIGGKILDESLKPIKLTERDHLIWGKNMFEITFKRMQTKYNKFENGNE